MTHTHATYNESVHSALHLLADDMGYEIPSHTDTAQERAYLRALMNMRDPAPLPDGYREAEAVVLDAVTWEDATASSIHPRIALWRGDITRLQVDVIVNAANSAMLGCRAPGHTCIDNAIHSAAGLELRQACADAMDERGDGPTGFPTGEALLTPGFHLPARFVLHTVGPIVSGELTQAHREAPARTGDAWRRRPRMGSTRWLSAASPRASSVFPRRRRPVSLWRPCPTSWSPALRARTICASFSTCSAIETRRCTAPFSGSDPINE